MPVVCPEALFSRCICALDLDPRSAPARGTKLSGSVRILMPFTGLSHIDELSISYGTQERRGGESMPYGIVGILVTILLVILVLQLL
jgi:hypothetical protein